MDKFKLQYEMRAKGITAEKLCEDLSISQSTFSRKINGKSEFTLGEIKKIMKYLGLENPMPIFFAD